jgi:hypothetical protein
MRALVRPLVWLWMLVRRCPSIGHEQLKTLGDVTIFLSCCVAVMGFVWFDYGHIFVAVANVSSACISNVRRKPLASDAPRTFISFI